MDHGGTEVTRFDRYGSVIRHHLRGRVVYVDYSLRCELFPDDLDAAIRFYVEVLGFDMVRDDTESAYPYAALALGAVKVGLGQRDTESLRDSGHRHPPVGAELVLDVPDLKAAHARVLAARWPLAEDLTARPWGLTDFRVIDPVGYYWRITTPEDAHT